MTKARPSSGGNADTGKCLERMHRTDGSTERAERLKDLGIKRATRMQNGFSFPVFRKELSQAFRDVRNRGIRRGDQNVSRRQGLPRNSGKSVTLSDESNGATSGRLGACNDAKDFPARFTKRSAESAANPSCADDRKMALHAPARIPCR